MSHDYIATLESYVIETDGQLALPPGSASSNDKNKANRIIASLKALLHRVAEVLQKFWRWLVKKANTLKNYLKQLTGKNPVDTRDKPVKPIIDTLQNRLEGVVAKYLPRMINEGEAAINSGENMSATIAAGKHITQWKDDRDSFENHAATCKEYNEILNNQTEPILTEAANKNLNLRCSNKIVYKYRSSIDNVLNRGNKFYESSMRAHKSLSSKFESLQSGLQAGRIRPTDEIEETIKYLRTASTFIEYCINVSGTIIGGISAAVLKFFPTAYKAKT